MIKNAKPVIWIVSAVAAFCAISFALALPSAYFFLSYQSNKGELLSEAQAMATVFVRDGGHYKNIADLPNDLLADLVNEDLTDTGLPENRVFLDLSGRIIASSDEILDKPIMQASAEVIVDDNTLGTVVVSRSLLPILEVTFFVTLLGIGLASILFYILRILPVRALYKTLDDLATEKHKASITLNLIDDAVLMVSHHGDIEYANGTAEDLLQLPREAQHTRSFSELPHLSLKSKDSPEYDKSELFSCSDIKQHMLTGKICHQDGISKILEGTLSPIRENSKQQQGWVLVLRDVTEKFHTEQKLIQLASYDSLTALPNRYLFRERLQRAMMRAHRVERLVALLYLDIDRFKAINDSLGHSAGDDLLRQIAHRLQESLRSKDTVSHLSSHTEDADSGVTVSRLGGDEFTIILEDIIHVGQVTSIAQRIINTFSKPFQVSEREITATTSLGITIYPFDDTDIDEMIKHADAAMYRSKSQGRNTFNFYSTKMNLRASERLIMESKLRKGLENDNYEIFLQPKSTMQDINVNGYEALLRFRDVDGSLIPPNDFISILEETGLIVEVGQWVISKVCKQIAHWKKSGKPIKRIAINLSTRQLQQENFVDFVQNTAREYCIEPQYLEFEITESLLMASQGAGVTRLHSLRKFGIHISIDDFGTGYSSLAYLKQLPVDSLKIDQSFVHDITTNDDSAAIVRAIILLAHSLRMDVVAEGVESIEQLNFLSDNGCDIFQGYWLAKPMCIKDIEHWQENDSRLIKHPLQNNHSAEQEQT